MNDPGNHFAEEPFSLIDSRRLERAKLAYTTRLIPTEEMRTLVGSETAGRPPRSGDVVLGRVDQVGQHARIELRGGRRSILFPGDEIVVCYGNRYAPDQFEAEVPPHLGACDLVAAGGIAASTESSHSKMGEPTSITPLGLIGDDEGMPLNLESFSLPMPEPPRSRPTAVAVIGTSMNAGKTTTAANLVRGLAEGGLRVGAAKVTGTGAGGDVWHLLDAGADTVLDFTHAGLPSTYMASAESVERVFRLLTRQLAESGVDAMVIEVADGLHQRETATLLRSPVFAQGVDQLLFAGSDALGASAGVAELREMGLSVTAISGVLSASPLAARETEAAVGLPVLDIEALREGVRLSVPGAPRHAPPDGSDATDVRPAGDDDDTTLSAA